MNRRTMIGVVGLALSIMGSTLQTVHGSSYELRIRNQSNNPIMDKLVDLSSDITLDENDDKLTLILENTSLIIRQDVKDEKVKRDVDLAEEFKASAGDKILAGLEGKRIVYAMKGNSLVLLKDETEGNQLVGPVSGILDHQLNPSSWRANKEKDFMGSVVVYSESITLDSDADFSLLLWPLSATKDSITSYIIELRKEDEIPIYSRLVVGLDSKSISDVSLSNKEELTKTGWGKVIADLPNLLSNDTHEALGGKTVINPEWK